MPRDPEKHARILSAIDAAGTAYATLVFELGEKGAALVWAATSRKGRGRPRGATSPENDQKLLKIYDEHRLLVPEIRSQAHLPGIIANKLHAKYRGKKYGGSVEAITKKINRLLRSREEAHSRSLGALLGGVRIYPPTSIATADANRPKVGRTKKGRI